MYCYTSADIRRFSKYFVEGDKEVCWEWQGGRNGQGYGLFWVPTFKRNIGAHRVSFEIWYGVDIKEDNVICHKCDNPRCMNPHHLFEGSQSDNMIDRKNKTPKVTIRTFRWRSAIDRKR